MSAGGERVGDERSADETGGDAVAAFSHDRREAIRKRLPQGGVA